MYDNLPATNLFVIDKDRLDEEWVRQPGNFFTAAKALAEADREVEECKARLDVVAADLYKDVRTDPGKYGLEKPTEGAINAVVITSKEHRKAHDALVRAKYAKDLWKAAVGALDHKKSALERLVSLHGQSYFATPVAPEPVRDDMRDKERSAAFKGKGVRDRKKQPRD